MTFDGWIRLGPILVLASICQACIGQGGIVDIGTATPHTDGGESPLPPNTTAPTITATPPGNDATPTPSDGESTPGGVATASPTPSSGPTPTPEGGGIVTPTLELTPTPEPQPTPPMFSEKDPVETRSSSAAPGFAELLDIEVEGTTLYSVGQGGLYLFDITDLNYPEVLTNFAGEGRYYRLAVEDGIVFASNRDFGISIINATDPAKVYASSSRFNPGSAEGVDVEGSTVYIASHTSGLHIAEYLGMQGGLRQVGQLSGLTNTWTVRVRDGLAYIADGPGGLRIADVSDPTRPVLLSTLDLPGVAEDLALGEGQHEHLVFVGGGSEGVAIVDITTPTDPVQVSSYRGRGTAFSVDYEWDYLYVGAWTNVDVVDLADISRPILAGTEEPSVSAMAVIAHKFMVFVADWTHYTTMALRPSYRAPEVYLPATSVSLPKAEEGTLISAAVAIANDGYFPLEISTLAFSTSDCSYAGGPLDIPAEDATVVEFMCRARSNPYTARLTLTTNDPDEPSVTVSVQYAPTGMAVSSTAPNFTLPGIDGDLYELEKHRGKVVMLGFFATF